MRKRATMQDIADAVGVHVSTVSRALNPTTPHRVATPLADEIQRASRELNFRPNAAAYSLKTNRTRSIGLVVPDIADAAFAPVIGGIEDALSKRNYVAMLANTGGSARREGQVIELLRDRGVDGLVLANVQRDDATALGLLRDGLPVVTVVRRLDGDAIPSVVHDEEDGMRRVVTHLVSLGHRAIAHIAGPQNLSTGYSRRIGFERHWVAMRLGGTAPAIVTAREFTEAEGERCAEELLATGGRAATAVVCANDRLAIGAIGAFRRLGLACPEAISVTGYNDMPLADRLMPPLTTVRVNNHRCGLEAAELLLELIAGGPAATPPRHIVLPVELMVRRSTAAPRGA